MLGVDDEFRQRPAETIMHALRKVDAVRGAEKVEIPLVIPLMHDGETVEQRNVVPQRHHAHIIEIGREGNHCFGARTVLRVNQDHVGVGILQRNNTFVDGAAKIVGIHRPHSIDGTGLPDD